MNNAPRISVVLPTLNRSNLLPRAIGSVLGQSYCDLELIVVDDGSDEDIAALVAGFGDARARVVRHATRRGAPAARNTGLKAARGDLIAFQDSDDEWRLHKLENQVATLDASGQDAALVICGLLRYRTDGSVWSYPERSFVEDHARDSLRAIRHHAKAFTQTWLARRSVLTALGGFQEDLKIWDDWELLLRIAADHRIVIESEPLALSYVTAGSVSSDVPARVTDLEQILAVHRRTNDPALQARLHYLIARYRYLNGNRSGAWQALRNALSAGPADVRSWAMALLLLSPRSLASRVFNRAL